MGNFLWDLCLHILQYILTFFSLKREFKYLPSAWNSCLEEVTSWMGFPRRHMVKNLPANARDAGDRGSIPGLGRLPAGGHGNPLQYSCLRKFMERGAWRATAHGVTESRTHWMTKGLHACISMHAHNLISIKMLCKLLTLHKYTALSSTT